MEERKMPPVRRGNIDGIRPRKTSAENQAADGPQAFNDRQTSGPEPDRNLQEQKPADKKPKKNKNLLVIILAMVILIGLSAFAVYTGLLSKSADEAVKEAKSGRDNAAGSSEFIDQTINEIDQLNDKSDTSGEGLSDEKLGL